VRFGGDTSRTYLCLRPIDDCMADDAASLIGASLSRDVDIGETLSELDELQQRAGWNRVDFRQAHETRQSDLGTKFSGGFKTPDELVE